MAKRLSVKHRMAKRDKATARKKVGAGTRKKDKIANARSRKAKKKKAYRSV